MLVADALRPRDSLPLRNGCSHTGAVAGGEGIQFTGAAKACLGCLNVALHNNAIARNMWAGAWPGCSFSARSYRLFASSHRYSNYHEVQRTSCRFLPILDPVHSLAPRSLSPPGTHRVPIRAQIWREGHLPQLCRCRQERSWDTPRPASSVALKRPAALQATVDV